uniref:Uncharacterized protein n=1 Tax=Anguilla anguilla TaxID=7936 RepID=A0A0E9TT94_ANGAN
MDNFCQYVSLDYGLYPQGLWNIV